MLSIRPPRERGDEKEIQVAEPFKTIFKFYHMIDNVMIFYSQLYLLLLDMILCRSAHWTQHIVAMLLVLEAINLAHEYHGWVLRWKH